MKRKGFIQYRDRHPKPIMVVPECGRLMLTRNHFAPLWQWPSLLYMDGIWAKIQGISKSWFRYWWSKTTYQNNPSRNYDWLESGGILSREVARQIPARSCVCCIGSLIVGDPNIQSTLLITIGLDLIWMRSQKELNKERVFRYRYLVTPFIRRMMEW